MTDSRLRFRISALFLTLSVMLAALLLTAGISVQAQTSPDPTPKPPKLLVAPKSGAPGTVHLIFASNLIPNEDYHLEIVYREANTAVVSLDVTGESNGSITYNFISDDSTAPGVYFVTLYQGERVLLAGSLTVEGEIPPTAAFEPSLVPSPTLTSVAPSPEASLEASVETLIVDPASGVIGTTHSISAMDLQVNTTYRLDVIFADTVVFSTQIASGAGGELSYSIFSQPGDTPGVYGLKLYEGDTLVREGTFTILGDSDNTSATATLPGTQPPTDSAPTLEATATPTITISPTAPPSSNNGDTLRAGQPVAGDLTDNETDDSYTFTGAAGALVTIRMESPDFDAYLLLLDPAGEIVMRNDNGGGNFNAEISGYALPGDGTYTVVATSRPNLESNGRPESIGRYVLTLSYARTADSGTIASGETVIGQVSDANASPNYTFEADGGMMVTIDLASDDFDPFVILIGPDGRQIMSDDDSGPSLYARIEAFELPDSGTYTIQIDGFRGQTGRRSIAGSYRLALRIEGEMATVFVPTVEATATPGSPTTAPTAIIEGESQPIGYGDTVQGELGGDAQTAQYSFSGTSGDMVTIALNSDAFDPTVILLDEAGNTVISDDDSGPGVYALIQGFALPASGSYTIVIDGYRGVKGERRLEGSYTLSLSSDRVPIGPITPTPTPSDGATPTPLPPVNTSAAGEIQSGETVTGSIQGDIQTASYTFTAHAGDVVTIDLTSANFDPLVRLLDSAGNELIQNDDSGGNSQARIADFAIPAEDTYTIVVDTFRGFSNTVQITGDYSLSLVIEQGSAPATSTLPPTPAPTETATVTPRLDLNGNATATPAQPRLTLPGAETPIPEVVVPAVKMLPPLVIDPFAIASTPLNVGDVTQATLTGGQNEALVFTANGNAGDTVALYVYYTDVEIDTLMRVFAPDGTEIAVDDDSGRTFNPEILPLTLPQTGEYRIVVQPYINGAAGALEVYYLPYTAYTLSDTPQRAFVTDKFQQMPLSFEATAGAEKRLVVERVSFDGGVSTITIRQNGVILAQTSLQMGSRVALDFIVPNDGIVTVELQYQGVGGAVLDLTLENQQQ